MGEDGGESLLEFRGLTAGYYKLAIVNDTSMIVRRGEIATLIGPNGCGKSTLVKSIFGFSKVMGGQVLFAGEEITHLPSHEVVRRGVGYAPQIDNVFPKMSVEENLEMGAYTQSKKDQLSEDMSRAFEIFPLLGKRRRQKAVTLSGGERQMLAIARALMSRPKLLILDEPTASLSPKATSEVFERIRQIRERGITILQVEQNVKKALEISDRVHVMLSGRRVLEGTPEEILAKHDLGKIFLGILPSGQVVG